MSAVSLLEQHGERVGVVGGNHARRVGAESDFLTRSSFFPANSIQSKLLAHALRVSVKPALGVWAHVPSARWAVRLTSSIRTARSLGTRSVWRCSGIESCTADR